MQTAVLYLVFILCKLFSHLLKAESIDDTYLVTIKTSYTTEFSPATPVAKGNGTVSSNSAVSSTYKQINTEDTTTKKYGNMKKMNLIKGNVMKVSPTSNPGSIVSTYRVNSMEDGTTCILMTVDALLSIIYTTKLNEKEEKDIFVPDGNKVDVSGDCSNEDKSSMLIKWKSFALNFDFSKTPGGERWFVSQIRLTFRINDSELLHINHPHDIVQAETVDREYLFPTPVGQSFKCHREIVIKLEDPNYSDIKVKLLLRELTVEPFIFKNNDFGPEYLCPATGDGSFRSETAPFIFGSLLMIAALFTIVGYAVYRYLKVNKVQYDAME